MSDNCSTSLGGEKGRQAVPSVMPSGRAGHGQTVQPAQDLLLDSYKNNSHKNYCKNPVGYFRGIVQGDNYLKYKSVSGNVPCKSWFCDECRPKNLKKLRARIFNSQMVQDYKVKGFRDKYAQKFLTLTYPGKEFRKKFTPLKAYEQMVKAYDKLVRAIKRKWGNFRFIRVVEPQQDGFPHFHVVLVGRSISKKEVLKDIENLWRFKYGMGFVRLNVITQSLEHAIRYITKYLSKNPQSMGKNKRIFTASRGALQSIEKKTWIKKEFFVGLVRDDLRGETEVIEFEVDVGKCGDIAHLLEFMTDEMQEKLIGISVWKQKYGI